MAPHSVLLVVVLLGLAMAPADGQNIQIDQSIKANMSSGSGSGSAPNKQANVGGTEPLGVVNKTESVRKLLTLTGRPFFQELARVFPSTAKLLDIIRAPHEYTPEHANKITADLSAQLRLLVQMRAVPQKMAEALERKTVREIDRSAMWGRPKPK